MEKGRLHWPCSEDGRAQLTREEDTLLIGGIDFAGTKPCKWYRRAAGGNHDGDGKVRKYWGFSGLFTVLSEVLNADEPRLYILFSCRAFADSFF